MRTYGVSMFSTQNGLVPCIMPFYTAETNNSLERGSRPYTVVEILREVFNEDFEKAIQCYMDSCPEGAAMAIGMKEAREFKLVRLNEPRVQSSLRQPACTTAVDLVFTATVSAMIPVETKSTESAQHTIMEQRRFMAEFRMRYMIGLWDKRCSVPMIAPNNCFPHDLITEQKTDYGCAGTWERGLTYAISLSDAGALLRESKEFAIALGSGRYVYLEGHFCLDVEPYVECRYGQLRRLTAYARHHIEECCISFTVQGRYANTAYEDAQAARKTPVKDKYQSRHGLGAEPETKERVKENSLFAQDSRVWMKLKMMMPDNIADAVQFILDEKGITQQELSMRMGVSRAALRKWCGRRMSLKHIVAICIALDVRADIGVELVRLAGHTFQNNREHNLLLAMLYETKDLSVARANEIMRQEKLDPLTEGMDEEIAV